MDWVDRSPFTQAFVVGSTAGGISSLVAIGGYFVVPLTAEEYGYGLSGMETTFAIFEGFAGYPPLYHAVILFGIPLAVTVGALLYARQLGLADRTTDLIIIAGILVVPIVTIWAGMVGALVLIGITDSPVFVPYALMFGLPITMVLSGFVATVEFIGIVSGYALVAGLTRHRR